jgi:peptide/nickel transport system ATP-binding protein
MVNNLLLGVSQLSKRFRLGTGEDLLAVSDVSFQIPKGQVVGLIGESGSGKTTVARCIAGLTKPTTGQFEWSLSHRPRIGMVFQDPRQSLNPRFRTWESIADPLYLGGQRISTSASFDAVAHAASDVGLTLDELLAFPAQLSDEPLQRASLARALVTDPDLLIMDEPTSSLDAVGRAAVLELIRRLCTETSLTVLLITHDLSAVRRVSNEVCIMYLGSLVEVGSTSDIFTRPNHPYTMGLLSSYLEPDPAKPPAPLELRGEIPSPLDRPSGCPLVPRCPWAIEECSVAMPPLDTVGERHRVACIRAREVAVDSSSSSRPSRASATRAEVDPAVLKAQAAQ